MRRAAVLVLFGPDDDGLAPSGVHALDDDVLALSGDHALPDDGLAHLRHLDPARVSVLLLERAAELRSAPGQVAFPGGMSERGEDPTATALREAREETGLDVNGVSILTTLEPRLFAVGQIEVDPVVAWWDRPSPVRAMDLGETASVFNLPVSQLLDSSRRYLATFGDSGYRGIAWLANVGDTEYLVWGFTARILADLLEELGWSSPATEPDPILELDYKAGLVRPIKSSHVALNQSG